MKKISELLGKVLTTAFSGQLDKKYVLTVEHLNKALEAIPLYAHSFSDFSEKPVLSLDTAKIDERPKSKKAECVKRLKILADDLLTNAPSNADFIHTVALFKAIKEKINSADANYICLSREEMSQLNKHIPFLLMASTRYVHGSFEACANITPLRRNFGINRSADVPDRHKVLDGVVHGICAMLRDVGYEPDSTELKTPTANRKGTMKRRPF